MHQNDRAFPACGFGYAAAMPRKKIISDADVYAHIRHLLAQGGDKAVAFGPMARATGLAATTLVQRYGTRDGMVAAALQDAWDRLDAALTEAETSTPPTPKGAQLLLKSLTGGAAQVPDLATLAIASRTPALRDRASHWRERVEAALALRLGGGAKGREAAGMIFALWQGQMIWNPAGDKSFRVKDAIKRLT